MMQEILQIWQILHPVIDLSSPLSDTKRQNIHWIPPMMLGGVGRQLSGMTQEQAEN